MQCFCLTHPAACATPCHAWAHGRRSDAAAAARCRGTTRSCGRWRWQASACSQPQPTRRSACGTSSRGAASRRALQGCPRFGCSAALVAASVLLQVGCKHAIAGAQVLEDHTRPVLSLAVTDRKLFSGSYDYTIKVWSLDTLQRLKTLTGARRVPIRTKIGHRSLCTPQGCRRCSLRPGSRAESITV